MNKQKQSRFTALAALTLGAIGSANAAVDTTAITAAAADVAIIGAAVLAVIIGVKAFKWLRAAA